MNAKQLKALEKRVQVLEDIEAIKNLKARYAAVCDDKYNPPKGVKLFTQDAVWDGGKDFGVHKGRAAIKKFFEGVAQNIVFAVHYFLQNRHREVVSLAGLYLERWYWYLDCWSGI